ncbi:MAG TPA: hypothetical protein VM659_28695 [Dongiaceae bacterium]|nr:hypothetical protein [Dongiaceae bacterium]
MKAGELYQALLQPAGNLETCYRPVGGLNDPARCKRLREIALFLATAQKFECAYEGVLDDQVLHATSVDFFRAGALRLPYPLCYFEFFGCHETNKAMRLSGIVTEIGPGNIDMTVFAFDGGQWWDFGAKVRTGPFLRSTETAVLEEAPECYNEEGMRYIERNATRCTQYLTTLLLFLDTKHASVRPMAGASDRVNERRANDGKKPIFDYNIVKLQPADKIRADLGGTHASPRPHQRRGHKRMLRAGGETYVSPCLVGVSGRGVIDKHYLVAPSDKGGGAK